MYGFAARPCTHFEQFFRDSQPLHTSRQALQDMSMSIQGCASRFVCPGVAFAFRQNCTTVLQ